MSVSDTIWSVLIVAVGLWLSVYIGSVVFFARKAWYTKHMLEYCRKFSDELPDDS